MKPGDFVEISIKSGSFFGVITSVNGDKLTVVTDSEKRPLEVTQKRVQRTYSGNGNFSDQALADFNSRRATFSEQIDLPSLWELLLEENAGAMTIAELSDLGLCDASASAQAAISRALAEDQLYFKEKKDGFEPHPQRIVEEKRRQIEAETRARSDVTGVQSELAHALANREQGPHEFSRPTELALGAIMDAAVFGRESTRYKRAASYLDNFDGDCDLGSNNPFLDLLIALGIWHPDVQLGVIRHGISGHFDDAILAEIPRDFEGVSERLDLSGHYTVAIDDPDTRDIDDAFSLEVDGDGYLLTVFIADPTALFALDSELNRSALERAASLYLPDQVVPMLPEAISTELASLCAGQRRPALAFQLAIDPLGNLMRFQIRECWTVVDEHLSYDEVDQLDAAGSSPRAQLLRNVYQLTAANRQQRLEAGALVFQRPECKVVVDAGGNVSIRALSPDSPSRSLISELMVWIGHETAQFCVNHQIPAIFRTQTVDDPDAVRALLERGTLANMFKAMKMMPRAALSTTPDAHHGLGIEVYTQVTSPIRRYLDLAMHFQLKAFLRGETPPLSSADLEKIAHQLEFKQELLTRIEREAKRYWTLKYFATRAGELIDGVVYENATAPNRYRVELVDVALSETIQSSQPLVPDERLKLRIGAANPRRETLRLSVVDG